MPGRIFVREKTGIIGRTFTRSAITSHKNAIKLIEEMQARLGEPEMRKALLTTQAERNLTQNQLVHSALWGLRTIDLTTGLRAKLRLKGKRMVQAGAPVSLVAGVTGMTAAPTSEVIAVTAAAGGLSTIFGGIFHLIGRTEGPNSAKALREFRNVMKLGKSRYSSPDTRKQLLETIESHLKHQITAHETYIEQAQKLLNKRQTIREQRRETRMTKRTEKADERLRRRIDPPL